MITVEKVLEKNEQQGQKVKAENQELLQTGVQKKTSNKTIWIILGIAAAATAAYFLFRKKGDGNQTKISS